MHIYCRSCNKQVSAEDIHLERALAKCRHCHAIFSIANLLDSDELRAAKVRKRPQLPQPSWMNVEEWGSDVTISYRHATWALLPLILFCVVWDGFLVVWYGAFLFSPWEWVNLLPLLFPIGHVAVGVGLTYFVLVGLFNVTIVRVSMGELTVRHGPIPVWGNYTYRADEIDQLYCSYFTMSSGGSGAYQTPDRGATLYLIAVLKDGTRVDLLSSLPDCNAAGYLEQKLEEKLKIEDRPMGTAEVDWT